MLFSLLGIPHIFVSLIDKFDKQHKHNTYVFDLGQYIYE